MTWEVEARHLEDDDRMSPIPMTEHGERPAVYERIREGRCPYGERLELLGEGWSSLLYGWCEACGCGWRFVTIEEDGQFYERAEIVMTGPEEARRLSKLVASRASFDESSDVDGGSV